MCSVNDINHSASKEKCGEYVFECEHVYRGSWMAQWYEDLSADLDTAPSCTVDSLVSFSERNAFMLMRKAQCMQKQMSLTCSTAGSDRDQPLNAGEKWTWYGEKASLL